MQSRIMKNRFLLTTAVLLGSVSLAAAQGMGGGAGGAAGGDHQGMSAQHEGATSSGRSGMGSRTVGEGHAAGDRDHGPSARHGQSHQTIGEGQAHHGMGPHQAEQNRHSESGREATTGAAMHQHGHAQEQMHQHRQAQEHRGHQANQAEASKHGRNTTGMATHEHGKHAQQRAEQQKHNAMQQRNAQRQSNGQQQQNRASTAERENTRQQGTVGSARQGETGSAQTQTGAAQTQTQARLSNQQRTKIRQSVLSAHNVPRVQANDIHFAVNRGVAVPSRVSVVSVSRYPELIDVFPEYRDDSFFVTEDEIIFVGPDRRVVNVVPVGSRAPFGRSHGYGYTAVNLPPDQIREVQEVLIDRGFLTGQADGVFGARTREALIAFQRKEGIQANGSISTRTVAALGLSNKIDRDENRGQASTVGEGRGGAQQPNATGERQGRMNNNRPRHNRATTGEGSGPRGAEAPSDQHHPRAGHNTTGEAAPHNKSTMGEGNNQPGDNNQSTQQPGGQGPSTTGQGNAQSPAQDSGSPGQGSSPTHHNR